MQGLSIKGLVLGILAIVVIDLVVALVLGMALGGPGVSPDMTPEQIREATEAFTSSKNFMLGSLIGGAFATVVGGFVAARVGDKAPYLNAGLLGAIGTALSFVLAAEGLPQWFTVGGIAVVLPAALLGGFLAAAQS